MIIGAFVPSKVWKAWQPEAGKRYLDGLAEMGVTAISTESDTYDLFWIEEGHRRGLQWFGGIACFSEHARQHQPIYERPELWPVIETGERLKPMEWYLGVTPTIEAYAIDRMRVAEEAVRQFPLDGFFLDFIRWPMHWETEIRPGAAPYRQSSFDPLTLARFSAHTGIDLSGKDAQQAAQLILGAYAPQWVDFKCTVISRFVETLVHSLRAIRPGLPCGAYVVPLPEAERQRTVGQRVADWLPVLDYLAPMVYQPLVQRNLAWAGEQIQSMSAVAAGKNLPVLLAGEVHDEGCWPNPVEEWRGALQLALADPGTAGLMAFVGDALFEEGRGAVLKNALAERA